MKFHNEVRIINAHGIKGTTLTSYLCKAAISISWCFKAALPIPLFLLAIIVLTSLELKISFQIVKISLCSSLRPFNIIEFKILLILGRDDDEVDVEVLFSASFLHLIEANCRVLIDDLMSLPEAWHRVERAEELKCKFSVAHTFLSRCINFNSEGGWKTKTFATFLSSLSCGEYWSLQMQIKGLVKGKAFPRLLFVATFLRGALTIPNNASIPPLPSIPFEAVEIESYAVVADILWYAKTKE